MYLHFIWIYKIYLYFLFLYFGLRNINICLFYDLILKKYSFWLCLSLVAYCLHISFFSVLEHYFIPKYHIVIFGLCKSITPCLCDTVCSYSPIKHVYRNLHNLVDSNHHCLVELRAWLSSKFKSNNPYLLISKAQNWVQADAN